MLKKNWENLTHAVFYVTVVPEVAPKGGGKVTGIMPPPPNCLTFWKNLIVASNF